MTVLVNILRTEYVENIIMIEGRQQDYCLSNLWNERVMSN